MELTNEQKIDSLQSKLNQSEKRLISLQQQAKDPETWAECGYYLQQDINAEISYYNVLIDKIQRLQERN